MDSETHHATFFGLFAFLLFGVTAAILIFYPRLVLTEEQLDDLRVAVLLAWAGTKPRGAFKPLTQRAGVFSHWTFGEMRASRLKLMGR